MSGGSRLALHKHKDWLCLVGKLSYITIVYFSHSCQTMRFSAVSSDGMFSNVFTRKANRVTSTNIVGEVRLYDSLVSTTLTKTLEEQFTCLLQMAAQ